MEKNGEPSKLTKALVHKIHGGRKKDSKFWQSEFTDSFDDPRNTHHGYTIGIEKPDGIDTYLAKEKAKRVTLYSILVIIGILFLLVSLRPDLFSFLSYKGVFNVISSYFPQKEPPHQQIKPYNSSSAQVPRSTKIPSTSSNLINQNKSSIPDYKYSPNDVSQAKRQILSNRYQSNVQQGRYAQSTQPNMKSDLNALPVQSVTTKAPKPNKSIYEITLLTGRVILSKNVMVSSDKVTYEESDGEIVSINKYEVKTLKPLKVIE